MYIKLWGEICLPRGSIFVVSIAGRRDGYLGLSGESLLVWGVVEQIPVERIPLDEIVPTNEAQGSFWQKNALVLLLLLGSSGVMALLAFEPGSR